MGILKNIFMDIRFSFPIIVAFIISLFILFFTFPWGNVLLGIFIFLYVMFIIGEVINERIK